MTTLLHTFRRAGSVAAQRIRDGSCQRELAFVAGMSAILSGWEVTFEHYRGSYGQRIMYTPVILSPILLAAGLWSSRNRQVARYVLPLVSSVVLADGVIGFGFHVRGVARKPGGWRLPVTNIVMGPPLFAPLLFGVGGYLGLVATFMQRAGDPTSRPLFRGGTLGRQIRKGRFQKHMAGATALAALLSGAEAWSSHYKNAFRYRAEWTPLVIAPLLAAAAVGAIFRPAIARTFLPAASLLAMGTGSIGLYFHARGVKRRPGGRKHLLYNVLYGPPLFAPLLFAASGFLGLLASLLRRER